MELTGIIMIYDAMKESFFAFIIALPRAYAFIAASQLLNPTIVPRIARNVAILIIAMPIQPLLRPDMPAIMESVPVFMLFFAKEFALGFIMGYLVFWLFWAVQAAGNYIDNQRGAAIASSIDPLQGHEASPLGILFSQAFVTYFFALGGFLMIITLLYDSYTLWPVREMLPIGDVAFPRLIFEIIDRGMMLTVLLSAPVVAIMFLAEFALALVSRFAPQVQVFILAMPIKSALAMLIMVFYLPILMSHAANEDDMIRSYFNRFYEIMSIGSTLPPVTPPVIPQ